jgi:predicted O-linked N-acetylglucosamine transferase (SPINDLY family)
VIDPELEKALHDMRAGRLEKAIKSVQRILKRRPNDHNAAQILSLLFVQSGRPESALPYLRIAVEAEPRASQYRNNYAHTLLQLGRYAEAAEQWQRAVEFDPQYGFGWLGLSTARLRLNDSAAAREAAERGLALRPNWPEMANALALALAAGDEVEAAVAVCERCVAAAPQSANLRSTCLLFLNYFSEDNPRLFEAHREFGRQQSRPLQAPRLYAKEDRSLHIGVLSADLRTHSVAFLVEPILRHSPPWAKLTVFSLAATPNDKITQRFRNFGHRWIEVGAMDDSALNNLIRTEQIDILLELNGHTGGNRLPALADKPAPLIVNALGYPNTTGLPAIDWRLVDSITDPPGAEAFCTEQLLRLDPCFLSYSPPSDAPTPQFPPSDAPITFGAFNALGKMTQQTLQLWAEILTALPGSRLLFKTTAFSDTTARDHFIQRLTAAGIDPERYEIAAGTGMVEHMAAYGRVHVALDTTPYNGTITTCEALWMGVPVVCLAGNRHAARVSASLLNAIGKSEFIAQSAQEYVAIAVRLAQDRAALEQLRFSLRETMRQSPLLDAAAYSDRFYAALRQCWVSWCRANS